MVWAYWWISEWLRSPFACELWCDIDKKWASDVRFQPMCMIIWFWSLLIPIWPLFLLQWKVQEFDGWRSPSISNGSRCWAQMLVRCVWDCGRYKILCWRPTEAVWWAFEGLYVDFRILVPRILSSLGSSQFRFQRQSFRFHLNWNRNGTEIEPY